MVVFHHVGAGNQTRVFCEDKSYSLLSYLSSPVRNFPKIPTLIGSRISCSGSPQLDLSWLTLPYTLSSTKTDVHSMGLAILHPKVVNSSRMWIQSCEFFKRKCERANWRNELPNIKLPINSYPQDCGLYILTSLFNFYLLLLLSFLFMYDVSM